MKRAAQALYTRLSLCLILSLLTMMLQVDWKAY